MASQGHVFDRLRHLWCGLHGHDTLLQFQQDRMFLRCVSCGHETPGWSLDEAPPTVTLRAEPRTLRAEPRPAQAMVRPRLISARRVA